MVVTKENMENVKKLVEEAFRTVPLEEVVGYEYQVDSFELCADEEVKQEFVEKYPYNRSSNCFTKVENENDGYIRLCSSFYDMDPETNCMDYHNVVIDAGDELEVVGNAVVLTKKNSPISKILQKDGNLVGNPFHAFFFDSSKRLADLHAFSLTA